MLRRLIVFSTVMIVALILMFIQNNVLVGDQELQLLMQKQPAPTPSATAPASTDSTYKITFTDLGGNLVNATTNEQQAVTKRLAGNERLSKIPVKSLSGVTADHALELIVGLEQEFGIMMEDGQKAVFRSVNSIVDFILKGSP